MAVLLEVFTKKKQWQHFKKNVKMLCVHTKYWEINLVRGFYNPVIQKN